MDAINEQRKNAGEKEYKDTIPCARGLGRAVATMEKKKELKSPVNVEALDSSVILIELK